MIAAPHDLPEPLVTVEGGCVRVRAEGWRTTALDPAAARIAARWLDGLARQRRPGWAAWGNEVDKFGVADVMVET